MIIYCESKKKVFSFTFAFVTGQALQATRALFNRGVLGVFHFVQLGFTAVPHELLTFLIVIIYKQKGKLLYGKFSKATYKLSFMDTKYVLTNIHVIFIYN